MQNIIVETKLAPPKHQLSLIRREGLLGRLFEGRNRRVTLVVGSAGYGKTTLASLWRQELIAQGHDVAWLSLSADDNDLSHFIAYLIASIQLVAPDVGDEALTLFNRDSTDTCDAFVAALVNDLQRYHRDIYWILDDYYLINTPAIHQLLEQLLSVAPSNFHLAIFSRTAPPIELARLRTHGQITEIDFAELRLSVDEAADFIALQGVEIEPMAMKSINDLTDGWIAGLQLISIALKRVDDPEHYVTTRLDKVSQFSDYLDSEVLSFVSTEDVALMVKVASCRKFNEELAIRLTGSSYVTQVIKRAKAENLFLVELDTDDSYQWFCFHPLMSQYLKERLRQLPAEEIRQLNKNACEWFVEQGLIAEAVRHAFYAEDYEVAADLIEKCGRQMVQNGQIKTLFTWGQKIPEVILDQRIDLQLAIAWGLLLCHRHEQTRKILAQIKAAEDKLPRLGLIELKLLEGSFYFSSDDTRRMSQAISEVEAFDDEPFLLGARATLLSIGHCYAGEYEAARDAQLRVRRISGFDNHLFRRLIGECIVGLSFALQGDMPQAERSYRDALVAAERQEGFYSDPACMAVSYLAQVFYETGRWEEGRKVITERLDIIDLIAPPDGLVRSYIALSRMAYFSNQVNEAKEHLESLAELGHSQGLDRLVAFALHDGVQIALRENDLNQAEELLRRLNNLADEYAGAENCAHVEIPAMATYANIRVMYVRGKWHEAIRAIHGLRHTMEALRRFQEVARLTLLEAMVLNKKGDRDNALALTEQSLNICQHFGLVRTVLDEGEDAIALVRKVVSQDAVDPILNAYIQKLLWNIEQSKVQREERSTQVARLVESLSEREMDVLQLLSKSMSNKKVARTLGVTPETVKWHLKNIYTKLDVGSRDEAVTRGRDLKLIK